MKTSVSFYTFGQDVDIREACEQSKAAGYDGVELCVSENGQLNMKTTDKELQQLRAMIDDKQFIYAEQVFQFIVRHCNHPHRHSSLGQTTSSPRLRVYCMLSFLKADHWDQVPAHPTACTSAENH